MKAFTHINATTVAGAVASLTQYGKKADVCAGGTDLIGELSYRCRPEQPQYIIDLKTIAGLDYIKEEASVLKIGALTRLHDIAFSPVVLAKYSALAQAARLVASWQIRNMGTIGGNICQETRCWYYRSPDNKFYCYRKGGALCYAVPGDNRYSAILGGQVCFAACASDTAIALSALNATVVTSKRSIAMDSFLNVLGNVLAVDEIVTEIQVPTPPQGSKQVFTKAAIRRAIDFALVSAAVLITPATGNVTSARIFLGGVAPFPWRAKAAEESLVGKTVSNTVADAAAVEAVKGAMPLPLNKYKIPMAKGIVTRAILA